jgi:hypothetical protein
VGDHAQQIDERIGVHYVPLRGIASALHSYRSKHRYMLFMTAYFDESGDSEDPTKNFMGMAGFIAPAAVWKQVEEEWDAVINAPEFALNEYFHMKDFAHNKGQFKEGWDKPRKDKLHQALIAVLVKAELVPVGAIVHLEAFESLTGQQCANFKSAYVLTAQECIGLASIKARILMASEKVSMVFARQETYGAVEAKGPDNPDQSGDIEKLFYAIKNLTEHGKWIGSYGSSRPQESIPLQAADMFAYELTKEFETILQDPPPRKMRHSLRELLRAGGNTPLIRLFDRYYLLRSIRDSGFPDQTGTEVIDDSSIPQMIRRRVAQDILFSRREYESEENYFPKWFEDESRRLLDEEIARTKGSGIH